MDNIKINLEKGENDVHPILLNDNPIGTITVNKYAHKQLLRVFYVEIFNKKDRGNKYFLKTINFLEDYGKKNGFKYLTLEWLEQEYIDSWKKRGFRKITPEEYDFFHVQKDTDEGKESLIKPLF